MEWLYDHVPRLYLLADILSLLLTNIVGLIRLGILAAKRKTIASGEFLWGGLGVTTILMVVRLPTLASHTHRYANIAVLMEFTLIYILFFFATLGFAIFGPRPPFSGSELAHHFGWFLVAVNAVIWCVWAINFR